MTKPFLKMIGLNAIGLAAITLGSVVVQGLGVSTVAQSPWYNCMTREVFTPEKQNWCDRWQTVQNGDYIIPTSFTEDPAYVTVTLENGRYQQPGEVLVSVANQAGWMAFGDVNDDGKEDAAVIFGVVPDGGTALVTYLTVVLDVDGEAQALAPVALGQRIMLNGSIAIGNSRVTVPLLSTTDAADRTYFIDGSSLLELTPLPAPIGTISNEADGADEADGAEPTLTDVPSPVGGMVKQVTIPGPETSVLVTCDQAGFEPFFFVDQGNWVGCQISDGAEPGASSQLTEPMLTDVPSPVGGTVKQVTIPGPETAVLVTCEPTDFEPFFFTDQGNWVGCANR